MSSVALAFLLYSLVGALVFLLLCNIARKLQMSIIAKISLENRKIIRSKLDEITNYKEDEFDTGIEEFIREALKKGRNYRAMVDEYLLNALELPASKNKERFIAIAKRFNFPYECMAQIRNRNPGISAMGSRRAGLYKLTEAIDDMIAGLDILSGENQFEILMGLARIGSGDAMLRAFEKIKNSVLINERSVVDILSCFPDGEEKENLFRVMIRGDTDYLTALFLKAADKAMAGKLAGDIKAVLSNGNKEVRIAAVRALSALGSEAPSGDLVRALGDSDWEVRAIAAKALGSVKTTEASGALFNSLYDQQWWVRQNSANALMNHPGYESLFILAAESGDKYTLDSIIAALDNGDNPLLLKFIRNMAA